MEVLAITVKQLLALDFRVVLEHLVDHLVDHTPCRCAVDCRKLLQCAHIVVDDRLTCEREHTSVGRDARLCHAFRDTARLELAALIEFFERICLAQAIAHRILEV